MNLGSIGRCSVRPHLAGDFLPQVLESPRRQVCRIWRRFRVPLVAVSSLSWNFLLAACQESRWLSSFAQATINTKTLRDQHSHSLNSKYLIGAGQCARMISCIEFLLAAAP